MALIGIDRGRRLRGPAGKAWDATTVKIRREENKKLHESKFPWSLAPALAVRVKRGSVTCEMIPLMRVGISEVGEEVEWETMVEVL